MKTYAKKLASIQVGQIIKNYRKKYFKENEKPWSQLDLSLAIGWENPSTLSRIEQGEVKPTRETIMRISKALKLDLRDTNILLDVGNYRFHEPKLSQSYIRKIVKSIQNDFNARLYPMLLIGDSCKINFWNNFAEVFFLGRCLTQTELDTSFKEITHIDALFDPKFGIKKRIINWSYVSRTLVENVYFVEKNNINLKYLFQWKKNYSDFRSLWSLCEVIDSKRHTLYNIPFEYNQPDLGIIHLNLSTSMMYEDRRFFIESFNPSSHQEELKLLNYKPNL